MSDERPREALSDGVVTLRPWTEADAPEIAAALDGDPLYSLLPGEFP